MELWQLKIAFMETLLLEHLNSLLGLAGIVLIAVISPGPDFAVVVRNSLIYSRKTGLLTALGIALGVLIHITYTLTGLGLMVQKNIWLFLCLKYVGAGYLMVLGIRGLRAKKHSLHLGALAHQPDISALSAVRMGFLTNALNVKSMLFFISLFSAMIRPDVPLPIMLAYGLIIFLVTWLWFTFLSLCLSGKRSRKIFGNISHWIERFTGAVLLGLGIKLLLTPWRDS